jgi:hypothetical protein
MFPSECEARSEAPTLLDAAMRAIGVVLMPQQRDQAIHALEAALPGLRLRWRQQARAELHAARAERDAGRALRLHDGASDTGE